jgi:Protein of unknown function (DUF3800)
MVTCFVDDSGSHSSAPAYVLSAFFTTPKHWEKIMREWLGMVHRYKVNTFHAVDCANGGGEFRDWSNRRKKSMFRNLINILSHHSSLNGCSASIVVRDYEEIVYPEAHSVFGGPKLLAFQLLLLEVSKKALQPINFVVDKPSKGWGLFEDIFEKTRKLSKLRAWAGCLDKLTPGNVRTFPQLQTADLLAYESYRELARRAKGKTGPTRRMRRSLWRLMVEKSLTSPYLEKNGLLRLIDECKKDGKF